MTGPSSSERLAVIAGVGGVVGSTLARTLVREGWRVVGLSRNQIDIPGVEWLGVDLVDAADCGRKLSRLDRATHLFCTARFNFSEGGREPIAENVAILRNLVDAVAGVSKALRHVHIVQGSKYYGSHVGPFQTPAKEDQPRSLVSNFYYGQQDYLSEHQRGKGWTWSASRPDALIHGEPGNGRNLVSVIATYASICREMNVPFSFPGGPASYDALYQCTSTDHLSAGLVWMAESDAAANQAYNIVNGDYFRWSTIWPAFGRYFGVEVGPPRKFSLLEAMADKSDVWKTIVSRYNLESIDYNRMAHWSYADYIFSRCWDVMSDMTKARLHGFSRTVETEAEFSRFFDQLKLARLIP